MLHCRVWMGLTPEGSIGKCSKLLERNPPVGQGNGVMWNGQKGGFPTGPQSALMVVQLGKRPSVHSTLQQHRSPHRRD